MSGLVKGVNILALVKVLRVAGRERAVTVLPSELHFYLSERILVSKRYPEEHHLALLRAVAALMPPTPDPWITLGRRSARADLSGVYRAHLRPGDPRRSVQAMPILWRSYHDTGELTVAFPAEREVSVELRGFVAPARELCRINVGYFSELLAMSGAEMVRCVEDCCVVEKADHCGWSASWSSTKTT